MEAFDDPAVWRIKRFLLDYPTGHLYVLTGYTSIWGLSWLASQTGGRPVTVVVGDQRKFAAGDDKRGAGDAMRFLNRIDVRFLTWYRTRRHRRGESFCHSKVYLVVKPDGAPVAALVGSANLTQAGLHGNVETMGEVTGEDLVAVHAQVRGLVNEAYDSMEKAREKVATVLGSKPRGVSPVSLDDHRRKKRYAPNHPSLAALMKPDPLTDPLIGSGSGHQQS